MIERQGSDFVVSCDQCSWEEFFDAEDWDWQDMIDEIKGDGWRVYKRSGEWRHDCPDCVGGGRGRKKAWRA